MLHHCLQCAYSLVGLPEIERYRQCSECGRWNTCWWGTEEGPDHRFDLACLVLPTAVLGLCGIALMWAGLSAGAAMWLAMLLAVIVVPLVGAGLAEARDQERGLPPIFGPLAVVGLWGNVLVALVVVLAGMAVGL